jgi:hypothetical protein
MGVEVAGVLVREAPDREDSEGRAAETVSKTSSAMTPFSSRLSSSCIQLNSQTGAYGCARVKSRADINKAVIKQEIWAYIFDGSDRPVGLYDLLSVTHRR